MASSRFAFHPAAVAEARAARLWYQERSPRAASGFLAELSRAFEFIARHPEGAQQTEKGVRRLVMRSYPFAIIYRTHGEEIQVVAVAHQHREPGYWKGR